jgi:hypothetical protein
MRVQTLTDPVSGLTVKAAKIVASDSTYYTAGSLFSVELYNGDDAISADTIRYIGDDLYYVSRTKDETSGKITSTTYYKVVLKDKVSSLEEENENIIPVFDSEVTVTIESADTYYTEDGNSYVDVIDGTVKLINIGGSNYSANECVYDETSGTYTVTTLSGKQYNIKIGETYATIEEVAQETEQQ